MLTKTALAMLLTIGAPPGRSHYSTIEDDPYEEPGVTRLETPKEGLERYRTIAKAIAEASAGQRWLAAALATVAVHESSLRRDVHECSTLGDVGQSYTLFQVKLGRKSRKGWSLCGSDYASTLKAAKFAAGYLKLARRGCTRDVGATPRCLFGRYGGLSVAAARSHPGVSKRASDYSKALNPLPLPDWARGVTLPAQ